MEDYSRLKLIFVARVKDYVNSSNRLTENNSLIYNMLNACIRFNILETVLEMALGYAQVPHKKVWSKRVWERARKLDDTNTY